MICGGGDKEKVKTSQRDQMLVEIATLYLKVPMLVVYKYLSPTEANRLCWLYNETKVKEEVKEEQCVDSSETIF